MLVQKLLRKTSVIAIVKPEVVKRAYSAPKRDKSPSKKDKASGMKIKSEKYFASDILEELEKEELEKIKNNSSRGNHLDVEV